eukprot:scaffold74679_cov31-Attheya_sp.AAC.1
MEGEAQDKRQVLPPPIVSDLSSDSLSMISISSTVHSTTTTTTTTARTPLPPPPTFDPLTIPS